MMTFENSQLWLTESERAFVIERAEWYKEILALEELTKEK